MAEEQGQSKTEPASPRRLEKATEQGQVAFSSELTVGVLMLGAMITFLSLGKSIGAGMLNLFKDDLNKNYPFDLDQTHIQSIFVRRFELFLDWVGIFFGVLIIISVAACVFQVGFHFTTNKLEPNFDRLNPANGVGKIFSMSGLLKGGLAILKIIAIGIIATLILRSKASIIIALGTFSLPSAVATSWHLVLRMGLYLTGVLFLLGILDYLYQRHKHTDSLKMSKQELKEEAKEDEGDPHVKGHIRQMAREIAEQKMLKEVPTSTVVLTNPTHVAVALKYDIVNMRTPIVVAKGAGVFAKSIVEMARKNQVAILERPPLARALYRGVKEGKEIPQDLFVAVAEVISLVMKLRGGT